MNKQFYKPKKQEKNENNNEFFNHNAWHRSLNL